MHLVLRADGGPEIGYGHLVRSSSLAEVALEAGHTVSVGTTTPSPARTVFPPPVDIVELPTRNDPEPFVEWLDTVGPDVVFTDCYPVDTAYQQAVRDRVPLAVLQDDARHAVCADLFINGNLYGSDLDYEFIGDPPETCLGTEYVLLRREIRERAADEPPWRAPPERAIVMMGGGDTAGLTPTVIRAFDGVDIHVDAIVGPGCTSQQEAEVRRAAADCSADVVVSRNPDDLVDRMYRADFAVNTASTTTYELLALGTPMVAVPVVDNQEPIAEALRRREIATVVDRNSSVAAFQGAIEETISGTDLRRRRQRRGQQLVDGDGVERVFARVISLVSGE
jgi:spore coat polysaccharide biosynthesis predicted glycosyltransferase SpsG